MTMSLTATEFLKTHQFMPSQHESMPREQRIKLYREVIGWLRLTELPPNRITWRQGFEMRCAINTAILITGVPTGIAKEQLKLMIKKLESVTQVTVTSPPSA